MPKSQHYYTTSQAGQLLGVTDDTVRRWAAEGRIEAETTPGGQMRIPVDEIRRVKAEGRLLPRAAPPAPRLRPGSEAARLAEQLEAERLRLKLERMRQQRDEAEKRARLEEERRRQEREEAERLEREQEAAERRAREDRERRQSWLRRAARRFESLPAEARLAAMQVFEQRLSALDPLPEDSYLGRLLDAVEEAARLPARVETENQRLMHQLLEEHRELAREAQHADLRDRALLRMHEALQQLGVETPVGVREAAARQALGPVLAEYRRRKLCGDLGAGMDESLRRAGATAEERERARSEWDRRSLQLGEADEASLRAAAAELEQAMRARVESGKGRIGISGSRKRDVCWNPCARPTAAGSRVCCFPTSCPACCGGWSAPASWNSTAAPTIAKHAAYWKCGWRSASPGCCSTAPTRSQPARGRRSSKWWMRRSTKWLRPLTKRTRRIEPQSRS